MSFLIPRLYLVKSSRIFVTRMSIYNSFVTHSAISRQSTQIMKPISQFNNNSFETRSSNLIQNCHQIIRTKKTKTNEKIQEVEEDDGDDEDDDYDSLNNYDASNDSNEDSSKIQNIIDSIDVTSFRPGYKISEKSLPSLRCDILIANGLNISRK
jgi:hypothetical protein